MCLPVGSQRRRRALSLASYSPHAGSPQAQYEDYYQVRFAPPMVTKWPNVLTRCHREHLHLAERGLDHLTSTSEMDRNPSSISPRQTLSWVTCCPDKQDCSIFKVGLQFSIHAGVTVIFHSAVKGDSETMTVKTRADNRLVCFMTVAVSIFHKPIPFQKSPVGVNRLTVYPKRATVISV